MKEISNTITHSIEGILTPNEWDSQGKGKRFHLALPGEINIKLKLTDLAIVEHTGSILRVLGNMSGSELIVKGYLVIKPFQRLG